MKRFIGYIYTLLITSLFLLPMVKADGGIVRYTILVLDVSGVETFIWRASQLDEYSWKQLHIHSSSLGTVKDVAEKFIADAVNSRDNKLNWLAYSISMCFRYNSLQLRKGVGI